MKTYRLARLFNAKSNRCFDVAMDHGFFNERGFLKGIENMDKVVKTVAAAAPDAVQLTLGQAHYLQSLPGKEKPALVLRTDVANVYGTVLPRTLFSRMIEAPVEQALRLDPSSLQARAGLADVLSREGKYKAAIEMFGVVLERDAGDVESCIGLSRALAGMGRAEEALVELQRAKEIAPENPRIRLELSQLYSKLGNPEKAREEAEAFRRLSKEKR